MKLSLKFFSLLLILTLTATLCSLFSTATGLTAANAVTIRAASVSGVKGETVSVPIDISGSEGINGFQFRVLYDEKMLEMTDAVIVYSGPYSVVNRFAGCAELMWTSTTACAESRLALLTFRLLKSGESEVCPCADASVGECFYRLEGAKMIDLESTFENGKIISQPDPSKDLCFISQACSIPSENQVRVDLSMSNAPAVYGFSLELNFDSNCLSFDRGIFSEEFPYGRAVCNEAGKVRIFACTEVSLPINGNAEMISVFFNLNDKAQAAGNVCEFTISFYNGQPAYTLDENRKTVNLTDVATVNASCHLTNPFDLNGDGIVNVLDVTVLLNYLRGSTDAVTPPIEPDLNSNGFADIADITMLLNYLENLA